MSYIQSAFVLLTIQRTWYKMESVVVRTDRLVAEGQTCVKALLAWSESQVVNFDSSLSVQGLEE